MMSPRPPKPCAKGFPPPPPTAGERVSAEVDDLPLLGVAQHFVGGGDLLELLLRRRVRVDVRVQLAGQLAIGLLQLASSARADDAEQAVVVGRHVRRRPAGRRRTARRRAPSPMEPAVVHPGRARRCPSSRSTAAPGHSPRTTTEVERSPSTAFSSPILTETACWGRWTRRAASAGQPAPRAPPDRDAMVSGKSTDSARVRFAVPARASFSSGLVDEGLEQHRDDVGHDRPDRRRGTRRAGRRPTPGASTSCGP